jgi:hypothetical protein
MSHNTVAFTDQQLTVLVQVAGNLTAEKRAAFIEKVAAYVRLHGDCDDAVDVVELAVDLALRDITQSAAP